MVGSAGAGRMASTKSAAKVSDPSTARPAGRRAGSPTARAEVGVGVRSTIPSKVRHRDQAHRPNSPLWRSRTARGWRSLEELFGDEVGAEQDEGGTRDLFRSRTPALADPGADGQGELGGEEGLECWQLVRPGRAGRWEMPCCEPRAGVTLIDGILAAAVLLGLALCAGLGWWWADPAAGYVLVYYAAREVREIFSAQLQMKTAFCDHQDQEPWSIPVLLVGAKSR
jgi:hypothetical protein